MNSYIKPFITDRLLLFSLLATFITLVVSGALIGVFLNQLPPVVPLFNQLPWGLSRLGTKLLLFIPVGLTGVLLFINLLLGKFYMKEPLLARLLFVTSLFSSILTMLFVVRTIQLVV